MKTSLLSTPTLMILMVSQFLKMMMTMNDDDDNDCDGDNFNITNKQDIKKSFNLGENEKFSIKLGCETIFM